jgi:hypothetical protein
LGWAALAQTTTVPPQLHSSRSATRLSDDINAGKCDGEDDLTLVSLVAELHDGRIRFGAGWAVCTVPASAGEDLYEAGAVFARFPRNS